MMWEQDDVMWRQSLPESNNLAADSFECDLFHAYGYASIPTPLSYTKWQIGYCGT